MSQQQPYEWLAGRRIAVFAERFPPQVGGVATSAARLCRLLTRHGAAVDVINRTDAVGAGLVETQPGSEGTVHRFGVMSSTDDSLQMLESIVLALHREHPFDLLHAYWAVPSGYLAALIGRMLGVPSYVCIRGNDVDRGVFKASQFQFLLWTLRHAGAISAVSTELRSKAGVLADRDDVAFVHNSVDTELFRPVPPHRQTISLRQPGTRLVGFVGELRFKKGMHVLLDAFRRAHQSLPLKLLLIGHLRRSDRPAFKEFVHQYPHIEPDIVTVPYVHDREELASFYAGLDLLVCPSLWEGMPNSVLEAMACGRIVLATDVGGVPDVIAHGQDGFMIPRQRLDQLDEALVDILSLPESEGSAIGERARRKMQTDFAPSDEFAHHMAIYERLLGAPPARART